MRCSSNATATAPAGRPGRLERTYAEVVETLKKTPFADLMKPYRDNDPEKRPVLLSVLGNTSSILRSTAGPLKES